MSNKKSTLIMPKFNQNSISDDNQFSGELSEDNNSNTITISFDSETQILESSENSSSPNSIQNNEESNDYPIGIINDDDNVDKRKKITKTKNSRKSVSNEKSQNIFVNKKKKCKSENKDRKKIEKNNSCSKNEKNKTKKQKSLDLSKLDDCYKKLSNLISKYDFKKIGFTIVKLFNDIDDHDKDDDKLYKEIKNIISNINNKESIVMMCLSILSSKNLLNKKIAENPKVNERQNKKDEIPEIINLSNSNLGLNNFYEASEEIEAKKEEKKIQNKEIILINGMKNFKDKHYSFGKHYYNNNNQIYCFFPKMTKFAHCLTLYCCRRFEECKVTCVVNKKSRKVKISGTHNHNQGISQLFFYCQYPCLTNKEWEHIQIFKGNNKEIVVIQS